ncbi:MAG: hypothetical protein ACJAT0_002141 [Nonlabens sp.]|jgi:hypothetical protein|uniref:hypothetical protein n=1 Tax=Nonlabens sp. TaxID=1888209 RepID=UPI0039E2E0CF
MKHIKFLLPILLLFFLASCVSLKPEDFDPERFNGLTKTELINKRNERPSETRTINGEEVVIFVSTVKGGLRTKSGFTKNQITTTMAYFFNDEGLVYKSMLAGDTVWTTTRDR